MVWFAMRYLKGRSYLAARGFLAHLLDEVPGWTRLDGDLVSDWSLDAPDPGPSAGSGPGGSSAKHVYWTRNQWLEPFILEYSSISQAARALRAIQRNWAPYPTVLQRRTALIAEALPPLPVKPKTFPFKLPAAPMGGFTLIDEGRLLGSAICTSPFPSGELTFVEDREGPPSRAYRKLWEALVLAGRMPLPGERCLDAGASPGGWTWALARLGAEVLAVDRAALDAGVAALPGVTCLKHDAFTLKPSEIGPVDWLFSDVICYPDALYEWISAWREAGLARNFICTLKMQGPNFDRSATERFASIPGSRILHLWHNRHELTWINLEDQADKESSGAKEAGPPASRVI